MLENDIARENDQKTPQKWKRNRKKSQNQGKMKKRKKQTNKPEKITKNLSDFNVLRPNFVDT